MLASQNSKDVSRATSSPGRRKWPALQGPPKSLAALSGPQMRAPEVLLSVPGQKRLEKLSGLQKSQRSGPRSELAAALESVPEERGPSRSESEPLLPAKKQLQPLEHRPVSRGDVRPPSQGPGTPLRRQQNWKTWAKPLEKFDRAVSKEFKRHTQAELMTLEMQKASCSQPSLVAEAPLDQGLSYSMRKENFKKEKYSHQFDVAQANNHSGGGDGGRQLRLEAQAAEKAEAEARELVPDKEIFMREAKELDEKIQDYTKSILLSHLEKNSGKSKQDAKAEEERREKEAELRRARKNEQMARDPKRKVALRIQSGRRALSLEDLDKDGKKKDDGVPMHHYEAHSLKSIEKIEVVNVLKMQNQCVYLNEGYGVDTMLKLKREAERLAFNPHATELSFREERALEMLSEMSWDDREERAKMMRQDVHVQHMLDKIAVFRSMWSYQLPFSDQMKRSLDGHRIAMEHVGALAGRKSMAEEVTAKIKATGRRASVAGAIQLLAAIGGATEEILTPRTRERQKAQDEQRARKRLDALNKASAEARARARRRLAIVKAAVGLAMHLTFIRKKNRAAEICRQLVASVGEFARVRSAMKGMITGVRRMQSAARDFLYTRRKRVASIQHDWRRLEDLWLAKFLKKEAAKIVQEQKEAAEADGVVLANGSHKPMTKAKQQTQAFLTMLESGVQHGDIAINPEQFKIPDNFRNAIINRWYMVNLKYHMHRQNYFVQTIKEGLAMERELRTFLNSGLQFSDHDEKENEREEKEEKEEKEEQQEKEVKEPVPKRAASPPKTSSPRPRERAPSSPKSQRGRMGQASKDRGGKRESPRAPESPRGPGRRNQWFDMSEDTCVKLIALTAQALRDVLPGFVDHPANQDVASSHNPPNYSENVDFKTFATTVIKAAERPCSIGAFGSRQHQQNAANYKISGEDDAQKGKDKDAEADKGTGGIEAVFKLFTPRLREITEAQTYEYRQSKHSEKEDPLKVGGPERPPSKSYAFSTERH